MNEHPTNKQLDTRLALLEEQLKKAPTTDDIARIVTEAIEGYFINKGKLSFNFIVGAGIFMGALAAIFGGFKALLGYLGIHIGINLMK